ncbi:hypothetical protein CCHR01_18548 [Colletotrichum chrysophilum]|uniref:Uncharacterized protein n=1 Tax=Colletotrichum chrysophilum TaxID=1836956 RepID=A0AAD9A1G3_9PEZI|nr:hypothetical protein CCHR01_18548 [Colletotrichum chrysophilum]
MEPRGKSSPPFLFVFGLSAWEGNDPSDLLANVGGKTDTAACTYGKTSPLPPSPPPLSIPGWVFAKILRGIIQRCEISVVNTSESRTIAPTDPPTATPIPPMSVFFDVLLLGLHIGSNVSPMSIDPYDVLLCLLVGCLTDGRPNVFDCRHDLDDDGYFPPVV